uniref:Alternative protein STAB2 n=1 Tax=Homo sapiens TaxID=9606 RepID=L8E9Z1_HUMAN|nr:alternative protein STAB2 [Homo sapiens]
MQMPSQLPRRWQILRPHQSMFTKNLPPSCSLYVPGTKSAQLYMPRRLPWGWPSVLACGPLPN